MFKAILPKTLWGQLVSLLILALLVSQAITLALFIDIRQGQNLAHVEDGLVDEISEVINTTNKSENLTQSDRDYLTEKSVGELTFRPGASSIRGKDDRPDYSQHFIDKLTAKLNNKNLETQMVSVDRRDQSQISLADIPKNMKLSIKLSATEWLIVERREIEASLGWVAPLVATMLMMVFFIIIIVSWIVRRLTKPLIALSEAAQDLGHGRKVKEIPETGTSDIRRLIRSFNQMNKKITRFVGDRTRLLASISHDLRTPITSLRLRAEYIQDKELQAKMIPIIEEMREMTESTLQFSKDSSAVEKTNNVDIASLLETLTEDYIDMGAKISLKNFDEYPQIILPMRMHSMKRALRNLIDNGLKFGQEVELDFTTNKHTEMIEITIKDQGPGIASNEFEQVFEPFYRLEKSRSKETGGVGLGLSISRGIIQAHGGDILLSNILNGNKTTGLQVKISLPFD